MDSCRDDYSEWQSRPTDIPFLWIPFLDSVAAATQNTIRYAIFVDHFPDFPRTSPDGTSGILCWVSSTTLSTLLNVALSILSQIARGFLYSSDWRGDIMV
jgi:hypothetical protein